MEFINGMDREWNGMEGMDGMKEGRMDPDGRCNEAHARHP